MTTGLWIALDHGVALLSAATWFAAGVTLALRRARSALAALVAAVLVTLARVVTVAILAGRGWWFVQEKVLLGLPMLGAAGAVAVLLAGPRLFAATRGRGDGGSAGGVISVFTAAYAALAGLAVTFLVGYPLTVSTALITISLVCAGALLTARVVAPPAENAHGRPSGEVLGTVGSVPGGDAEAGAARAPEGRSAISRRRFIGWTGGAVAVTAAGAGTGLSFLPAESVTTGGGPGRTSRAAVSVAGLRGSGSPAPGGIVRRHVLTAKKATVQLPSGRRIDAWTYNGQVPGPAITATQGDLIEVRLHNTDIGDGVTLHWHGYDVPCGEDGAPGVTQRAVGPGEDFVYRFRADQAGTYWYHTHHASHVGVRKGLYGTLVVKPRDGRRADEHSAAEQVDLTLPVHTFDGTVVIAGGDGRTEHPAPPGAPVRLRLINTDSDPHRIVLTGTPFRVVAVDGRDLNRPGEVGDVGLRLPAGGRYDLVFRMPDTSVALVIDDDRDGGVRLRPQGGAPGEARVEDTSGLPELDLLRYGTPAAVPFDARNADRHFTMVLDRGVAMVDGRPAYAHTVNGRGHPAIPDQLVTEGDIVRFTVVNRSLETHPWHLHGHPVLILSRDGTPSRGSPLWVDTFDVRPGEKWEVAFRAANPGIWMNHCHNLPHAHQGMMLQLRYDGVTTPFGGSHHGSPGHGH
ncbi:Multicopper oxidase with three cupredoxin domains (includes cell division protein FtsP and spore coat protein CotA) [Thermomonospora echinospora]|uniref:Multicopper oxidase with three cupredoxin domains (Includes cell division protein FtsP and spore coat protein CotA) n=1 Tax=Thermomonospora echinospora TaxID=1992 RepID=A0A1H6AGD2_9ACTN|nr:multicopper oxidase family protein [Thermomonospora echinospora]SEG47829.1 Multicopper oxidase with three cupredoxin domains (includes cell division protein FtsP and spore coat protein CotA) [Thermomonospora echinospora]